MRSSALQSISLNTLARPFVTRPPFHTYGPLIVPDLLKASTSFPAIVLASLFDFCQEFAGSFTALSDFPDEFERFPIVGRIVDQIARISQYLFWLVGHVPNLPERLNERPQNVYRWLPPVLGGTVGFISSSIVQLKIWANFFKSCRRGSLRPFS